MSPSRRRLRRLLRTELAPASALLVLREGQWLRVVRLELGGRVIGGLWCPFATARGADDGGGMAKIAHRMKARVRDVQENPGDKLDGIEAVLEVRGAVLGGVVAVPWGVVDLA